MGASKLFEHLVPIDDEDAATQANEQESLIGIVCRILDLKEEDISLAVPLTNYGLDSLSASALSFALRPLLAISQLQLLADISIQDLQLRIEEAELPFE